MDLPEEEHIDTRPSFYPPAPFKDAPVWHISGDADGVCIKDSVIVSARYDHDPPRLPPRDRVISGEFKSSGPAAFEDAAMPLKKLCKICGVPPASVHGIGDIRLRWQGDDFGPILQNLARKLKKNLMICGWDKDKAAYRLIASYFPI